MRGLELRRQEPDCVMKLFAVQQRRRRECCCYSSAVSPTRRVLPHRSQSREHLTGSRHPDRNTCIDSRYVPRNMIYLSENLATARLGLKLEEINDT